MDPSIIKEGDGEWKPVDQVHIYMGDNSTPKKQVKKKLSKQPQDPGTNLHVTSPPISPGILEKKQRETKNTDKDRYHQSEEEIMVTQEEDESYQGRYTPGIKSAQEVASESNRANIESALEK